MASKPEAISLCVLQKFICSYVHIIKKSPQGVSLQGYNDVP